MKEIPVPTIDMGMPHVTSFCWCLGLEMGSKIIGVMHLAMSICVIFMCSLFAESARPYMGTVADSEERLYTTWYKVAVSVAVITCAHVALAATLIVSAFKRIVTGLRLWVWVMCILYIVALLYIVVETCLHGLSGSGSDIFLSFLEGLVFFGVLAYCILCVNSYSLMLRSAEDMEGPNKTYY